MKFATYYSYLVGVINAEAACLNCSFIIASLSAMPLMEYRIAPFMHAGASTYYPCKLVTLNPAT